MSSSSSALAVGNSNEHEFKSPTTKLASKVRLLRLDEDASSSDDSILASSGGLRAQKRSRVRRPAVDSDSDSDDPEPSASKRPRESRSPVLSASDEGGDPQPASPASAAGSRSSPERDGIREALAQFSAILASDSDSDDVGPSASKPAPNRGRKLSSRPRKGKAAAGAARRKLQLVTADSGSDDDDDDDDDAAHASAVAGDGNDDEDTAAAAEGTSSDDEGPVSRGPKSTHRRRGKRPPHTADKLAPEAASALEALGFTAGSPEEYDLMRLEQGLSDGSRDLVVEKSILLESNFDELHGVDWEKGCYMGQELTARTKYRGLVKRRLVPVRIEGPAPVAGTPIRAGARDVGEMRSSRDGRGLAQLRLEVLSAAPADADALTCGDARVVPVIPDWMQF